MDKEMIELVANALCDFDLGKDAWYYTGEHDCQDDYRALARIAIKAMREPTEKMMVAAEHSFPLLLTFADKEESGSYIVWRAMIDAVTND